MFVPGFWICGIGSVPLADVVSSTVPPGFLVAEHMIPISDGSISPSSDKATPWSIKPFATYAETGWSHMIQFLVCALSALAAANFPVICLVKWFFV